MCLEGGSCAIGVNWGKAIPGIYWLNYFGSPFVRMFGMKRLLSTPAHQVRRVGEEGVLISLAEDPFSWDSPEYKERERLVLEHLGTQYFFNREEPDRETVISDEIARLIESSPAAEHDPSKPSVLRVYVDDFGEEEPE
ncbi:MAG: hypothetical protein V3T83_07690 [Acidobacteriota bacterium]